MEKYNYVLILVLVEIGLGAGEVAIRDLMYLQS